MTHPHAFGAPLGHSDDSPAWPVGQLKLYVVRINQGGYDSSGRYWGLGLPLYCAEDESGVGQFIRASSRCIAAGKLEFRYQRGLPWAVKP